MKVSVALCTYNGSKYLGEQLESISAQTFTPYELVVCDDCSQDDTLEIVRSFSLSCPFPVRVFANTENLGSNKNFEKTIGLCEGEVIALADQDDVWKHDKLEWLVNALQENEEAGYAFSDAEMVDGNLAPLGYGLWDSIGFRDELLRKFSAGKQMEVFLNRNVVTGATMVFRASLKVLVLPVSDSLVHDSWISFIATAVGAYGVAVPEKLIYYRQHTSQQIGARKRTLLERYQAYRNFRSLRAAEFRKAAAGFRDVQSRLREVGGVTNELLQLLEQKSIHFDNRSQIYSLGGVRKLRLIFSEVISGRYRTFSNSWESIRKDVLL